MNVLPVKPLSALQQAADYMFSCQTAEGDIRGIIGNQYMPYYQGAILELLIKAGYEDDPRVEKGLTWLLSMRQDDGGWIVPAQAVPPRQKTQREPALGGTGSLSRLETLGMQVKSSRR